MAALTTRQTAGTGATAKGSVLTIQELDNNFINLNTDIFVDGFPTINPSLTLNFLGGVDSRITTSRNSIATYYDSGGNLRTASPGIPRTTYDPVTLTPRGLLIEDSSVNRIRNNSINGVVTGTPGTLPTNWTVSGNAAASLTRTVVGTGIENGISYVDLKFAGTVPAVANPEVYIVFDSTTAVGAAISQTWTASCFAKIVGGSLAGIVNGENYIVFYNSSFGLTEALSSVFNYNFPDAGLSACRRSITFTTAVASTAFVHSRVDINLQQSAVVDFTIRIGMPQLEMKPFATSVIPTYGYETNGVTRQADICSLDNLNPWFNNTEGTILVELEWPFIGQFSNGGAIHFSDGTLNNYIGINQGGSGANPSLIVHSGGVTQANAFVAVISGANTVFKFAGSYKENNFAVSLNGTQSANSTDNTGTIPTVNKLFFASPNGNTTTKYIRNIMYFPTSTTNAQLQYLTA